MAFRPHPQGRDAWATSGCGHALPVQGEVIFEERPLPEAS